MSYHLNLILRSLKLPFFIFEKFIFAKWSLHFCFGYMIFHTISHSYQLFPNMTLTKQYLVLWQVLYLHDHHNECQKWSKIMLLFRSTEITTDFVGIRLARSLVSHVVFLVFSKALLVCVRHMSLKFRYHPPLFYNWLIISQFQSNPNDNFILPI